MRRPWILAAFVAVTVGGFLDVWVDWFPGFLVGFLLGATIERFDKRRRTTKAPPSPPEED